LSPGFAQAASRHRVRPPDPPEAPEPPEPPEPPEAPEFDLPDVEIDVSGMMREMNRALPMFARNEEDEDKDQDEDEHDEKGAHVYKMHPPRPRIPHMGRWEDGDWDEGSWWSDSSAKAQGKGTATLPVKGPITFQFHSASGDLEVSTTDKPQVTITVSGAPRDDQVALYAFGDRVEPAFRGRRMLRHGRVHVELPKGSRLDLSSMSGAVTAEGGMGEVHVRTMSGDVKIASVGKCDVQTISGDVHIDAASGPVRLHTVSGHGVVSSTSGTPQLEYQSASGDLDWAGLCAKDCHISAETVSGDLHLAVDTRSSFELSYTSHSGELRDEVELSVKRSAGRRRALSGGWLEATYGKGEGVIEADAFSGSLTVKKK
jgi:hypothetical protein